MYRSIMIPLDGSTFSEHALPIALSIARQHAAAVQLVHVHATLDDSRHLGERLALNDTVDAQMHESERIYLDGLAQRLRSQWDVAISVALLSGAAVAETLHSHACAAGIDLVVMTTHARSGLVRFWLGNVADTLVRLSTIPMLLIRPHAAAPAQPHINHEHTFKRILIALDGSPLAEQVIDHTLALDTPGQTSYTLLQAIDPLIGEHTQPPYTLGLEKAAFEQLRAEAQRYLERVAWRMRARAADVQTKLVVAQPTAAILGYAREHAFDLIAMATHGHGELSRFLLGSVADKVVRGAHTPVLLYHPASRPEDSARSGTGFDHPASRPG